MDSEKRKNIVFELLKLFFLAFLMAYGSAYLDLYPNQDVLYYLHKSLLFSLIFHAGIWAFRYARHRMKTKE